jgi:hypothetical protein
MAAKKAPSVAIFIGAESEFIDAVSEGVDITLSSSRSPYLGHKTGTPEEWKTHCSNVFAEAKAEEAPIIREAVKLLALHKTNVTVYCDAACFGSTSGDKVVYPTIASARAWKNVGSMARSSGATIIWL